MVKLRAGINPYSRSGKVWITTLPEQNGVEDVSGFVSRAPVISLWATPAEARVLAAQLLAASERLEPEQIGMVALIGTERAASLFREAQASVALDGETQSVDVTVSLPWKEGDPAPPDATELFKQVGE
jgi:hypothetical protein